MNTDDLAKHLLDLQPEEQREIAGCLLVSAADKEKTRRRDKRQDSTNKGGLLADNRH